MPEGIYALSFLLFSFSALGAREHYRGSLGLVAVSATLMMLVSLRAFMGHVLGYTRTDFPIIDGLLLFAFLCLLGFITWIVVKRSLTTDPPTK